LFSSALQQDRLDLSRQVPYSPPAMIGRFPRLLFVCLFGLPWQAAFAEMSPSEGAVAGILVLRNGNVLSGHVIRLKDHYQVQMPNGQLQVPVDQVELFCHSLDEAYEQRRRLRTGSTADSHLELARWCLRHRLYEHASRELLDARAIDPDHRKLAMLERQLQHLQQTNSQQQPASKKSEKNTIATPPQEDPKLAQHVSQKARAMFVRQIQPMLVKSCAATGCHGAGSSWQLNRLAVEGAGHPQATLGNLTSTLAQIDWQVPSESPLLSLSRTAHGKGPSEPLSLRQLQLLRSWLQQLAMSSQASNLADAHTTPMALDQGVRTASAAIEDPFDPEVFNRRYERSASPATAPIQSAEQKEPASQELPSAPLLKPKP